MYDYALVEKGAHNLVQLGMRKNMCGDTRTCALTHPARICGTFCRVVEPTDAKRENWMIPSGALAFFPTRRSRCVVRGRARTNIERVVESMMTTC